MNYEIIALGDGNYVRAVLDAAASVSNYGSLGAVGMFIGLMIMAIKGITDPGGPKLDLAPFAVSIVLFWVMFLIRVDRVIVSEIMVQPGEVAPRSFVVDNVPFGLAGVGYAVSTVTHALTKQYETSFGSATDSARGTTGGLGGSLMQLTQYRTLLSNPDFTDPPMGLNKGWIATYRKNMSAFAQNCAIPLMNLGVISRESIMTKPGLTGILNDDTAHQVRTTDWTDRAGTNKSVKCSEAKVALEKGAQDPEILKAFDEAAAHIGRKEVSAKKLQESFGNWTNSNAQQMQTVVATTIMHAVMREAAIRGSLSPADAQAIVMVEEAAARRNVQAAAEESLFIRILRPTVGFFEAFFYALAPIMAIVVCMGRFGWGMIGKYMALPLWVGLWFPMLAITQLYSNLQMQYFFERLGMGASDVSGASDAYSPMQLQQIATQAMDTLGAAATFTAATPAIAMSILFGGAVSMSYLAGRLQGSDMIDETKVAPQASSIAPIASAGGAVSGNVHTGNTRDGVASTSIAVGQAAESGRRAAESYNATQSQAFGEQLSQLVAKTKGTAITGSHITSSSDVDSFTDKVGEGLKRLASQDSNYQAAYNTWKDMTNAQQNQWAASGYLALEGSMSASVTAGTPGEALVGSGAKTTAAVTGKTGAEIRNTQSRTHSGSDGWKEADGVTNAIGKVLSHDKGLAAEGAQAISTAINDSVTTNSTSGISATDATGLSSTATEMYTSSQSYEKSASTSQRLGLNEQVSMEVAARNFRETYGANTDAEIDRYVDNITGMGGKTEFDTIYKGLSGNSNLLNDTDRKIAAAGAYLAAGHDVAADRRDDRAALTQDFLGATTATGSMLGGSSAVDGGAAVGNGAAVRDAVTSRVAPTGTVEAHAGGVPGAGQSAGAVGADSAAGIKAAGNAVAEAQQTVATKRATLPSTDKAAFVADGQQEVAQLHADGMNQLKPKQ